MPANPTQLLEEIRDRLNDLPERLAGARTPVAGGGGTATGGKAGDFGSDAIGKMVGFLVQKLAPKPTTPPVKAPAPSQAKPVAPIQIANLPLPVSIVKGASSIPVARNVPAPAPGAAVPTAAPVRPPPLSGAKTVVSPAAAPKTVAQAPASPAPVAPLVKPPAAIKAAAPVASPVPGGRSAAQASVSAGAAPGSAGGAGGMADVVRLLREMVDLLKRADGKREEKPVSAPRVEDGRNWQTVFDSQSPANRAQASPSIAISVRKPAQAGGQRGRDSE
jgi:hypothetical protein